ncbi:hypothetical protein FKP32DRAFT_1469184 [Trametes sanguinea]|nr:hypothetical protein FKP32DRAFT_1469184 [Trametes sanguinea]
MVQERLVQLLRRHSRHQCRTSLKPPYAYTAPRFLFHISITSRTTAARQRYIAATQGAHHSSEPPSRGICQVDDRAESNHTKVASERRVSVARPRCGLTADVTRTVRYGTCAQRLVALYARTRTRRCELLDRSVLPDVVRGHPGHEHDVGSR